MRMSIKIGTRKSDAHYRLDFHSLSLKDKLDKIIQKESLDLIHIQYIPPFFGKTNLNIFGVYSLKIPIVTTLHEAYFPVKGSLLKKARNRYLNLIEKKIVKKSKQVITHNFILADYLKKKHRTGKITTVTRGHSRKKTGKGNGKDLLFFGILSPGKGIEYLIDAKKHLKDCKLTIVGSTPNKTCMEYVKKLREKIKETDIKLISRKWITEKEKEKYYSKSDLVVMPYIWGPYNSAITHDAIEHLIPFVVTRVGAIWDLARKYNLGVITKERNPKKLAESIRECLKDHSKYKKRIKQFRDKYTWKNNGKEHLAVYKKAIQS